MNGRTMGVGIQVQAIGTKGGSDSRVTGGEIPEPGT